jgi:uncharacterized protein (UPF0147 family)
MMLTLEHLTQLAPWEWPPNTAEVLAVILNDPGRTAADKALAADLAGELPSMDDTMAEVLLDITGDAAQPDGVRRNAAISLGPVLEMTDIEGFDDVLSEPPILKETFERIQSTLHRVYADASQPKEVRRRALEASVRAPQEWHAAAIRTAYTSGDDEWKLTAVFGMGWVEGFDREIVEALGSKDPEIHREAVKAAGSQEVGGAWAHIAALIQSKQTEKSLRLAAINAAAGMPEEQAVRLLSDLVNSPDEDIAAAAEEALMMASPDYDGLDEFDEGGEDHAVN